MRPLILAAILILLSASSCRPGTPVVREVCPDARIDETFFSRDTVTRNDSTFIITRVDSVRIVCGGPPVPGVGDPAQFAPDSLQELPPPDTVVVEH